MKIKIQFYLFLNKKYNFDILKHKLNMNLIMYNYFRIAIMVHDYHDYCIGQNDLVGSAYLYTQLLRARGYELITISYENFSIQDNVIKRAEYLKQCMNSIQEVKSVKQTKSI